jgi:hypothetical protein
LISAYKTSQEKPGFHTTSKESPVIDYGRIEELFGAEYITGSRFINSEYIVDSFGKLLQVEKSANEM